ncbi:MAG: hypothetical protein HYV29_02650, partial [Ignavibacteriales bacterium]|nr:hypothetical protein [Ignavibacteriales bacterium]
MFVFYNRVIDHLGLKPKSESFSENEQNGEHTIVILGFHRAARALTNKIKEHNPSILEKILVVDYNTEILKEVRREGMAG